MPFLSRQGGNILSVGKVLHSSATSKLKHLQQNNSDKMKSGKKEDFQNIQGQQQVYLALSQSMLIWTVLLVAFISGVLFIYFVWINKYFCAKYAQKRLKILFQ